MRCFVGIWPPKELIDKIMEIQKNLEGVGASIKMVEPYNLHITLAFLGELNDKGVKEVISLLKRVEFDSFTVKLEGLEVFPSLNFIRVVMIGVKGGKEELLNLQEKILFSLKGFKLKHAPPHLTLGRVKSAKNKEALIEFLNKAVSIGEFKVKSFKLMKSELSVHGPKYSAISEFKLMEPKA